VAPSLGRVTFAIRSQGLPKSAQDLNVPVINPVRSVSGTKRTSDEASHTSAYEPKLT
jgi:hypothetical protein